MFSDLLLLLFDDSGDDDDAGVGAVFVTGGEVVVNDAGELLIDVVGLCNDDGNGSGAGCIDCEDDDDDDDEDFFDESLRLSINRLT